VRYCSCFFTRKTEQAHKSYSKGKNFLKNFAKIPLEEIFNNYLAQIISTIQKKISTFNRSKNSKKRFHHNEDNF